MIHRWFGGGGGNRTRERSEKGAANPQCSSRAARSSNVAPLLLALLLLGAGLRGETVFNTGPFDCEGGDRTRVLEWRNPGPEPMRLKKLSIWMGMSRRGIADYEGTVRRISDGALVSWFAWDHYGEPNGPHTLVQDFAPDWIELAPGDGLRLFSWCDDFGKRVQGHHVVGAWWDQSP